MEYCVYILFSPSSEKYYIGQTSDLAYRMEMHNVHSITSYTSKYRPWELKIKLPVSNRSEAILLEKYLKKKPRDFLVRVIEEKDLQQYILNKFCKSDGAEF